jgi:hypothetical protein
VPFDERDVLVAVDGVAVDDGAEAAAAAHGHGAFGDAFDEGLGAEAIRDQIGNAHDAQLEQVGERAQIFVVREAAVVLENGAHGGGRLAARKAAEVDRGLGQPRPREHTAGAADDGNDVAGHHDVIRTGIRRHRGADRRRAVARRDAGGDAAARLDRGAVRAAHNRRRIGRHQRNAELTQAFLGECQAHETTAVHGHEIDRLRRHHVGGHAELRLARLRFGEDHEAAGAEVGQRGVDLVSAHEGPPERRAAANRRRCVRCRAGATAARR